MVSWSASEANSWDGDAEQWSLGAAPTRRRKRSPTNLRAGDIYAESPPSPSGSPYGPPPDGGGDAMGAFGAAFGEGEELDPELDPEWASEDEADAGDPNVPDFRMRCSPRGRQQLRTLSAKGAGSPLADAARQALSGRHLKKRSPPSSRSSPRRDPLSRAGW